jgi:putative ABC transport system substrate-binding protein
MRRREFIALVGGGAAVWPLAAHAQQSGTVRRVVVLMGAAETVSSRGWLNSFSNRLQELGWHEGGNLFTRVQWWNDRPEQMRLWAAELIAGSPDIAVTFTNLALEVMKPIAGGVPVVFIGVGDPVGSGFISSFAHPGGNATGFASHDPSLGSKWLEVLKEIAPNVSRVLVIMEPGSIPNQGMFHAIQEVAFRLGVEATARGVHNAAEIEDIIKPFAQQPNGGLVILLNAITVFNRSTIISLARQYRLPDIYALADSVAAGGLLSYGLDWDDQFRRAAEYVDKILRGTKPADLPVQAPTKYVLTVNLKTAKALGLAVPQPLLARADEVIE